MAGGGGRGKNTFRISVQIFFLQISRQVNVRKVGWMLEKQVLMIIFILSLTTVNIKATFCVVPVIINIIDKF